MWQKLFSGLCPNKARMGTEQCHSNAEFPGQYC